MTIEIWTYSAGTTQSASVALDEFGRIRVAWLDATAPETGDEGTRAILNNIAISVDAADIAERIRAREAKRLRTLEAKRRRALEAKRLRDLESKRLRDLEAKREAEFMAHEDGSKHAAKRMEARRLLREYGFTQQPEGF